VARLAPRGAVALEAGRQRGALRAKPQMRRTAAVPAYSVVQHLHSRECALDHAGPGGGIGYLAAVHEGVSERRDANDAGPGGGGVRARAPEALRADRVPGVLVTRDIAPTQERIERDHVGGSRREETPDARRLLYENVERCAYIVALERAGESNCVIRS